MNSILQTHIQQLLPKLTGKTVYVATSGGVDSMVLLSLCHNANLNPTALHCNFKLRNEDSYLDEEFVKNYCETNAIAFESIQFETAEIAKKNKETIQVCARNLRYDWFNTFLQVNEKAILLTAHHANDSIETFFINLLRGTSIKGLTGIQTERKQILRPLLTFKKAEIKDFALSHNIPFREDISNTDTKYTRNKVRHELMPLMESMTDQIESKILTLMNDLNGIDDFITSHVNQLIENHIESENGIDKIEINQLLKLEQPILLRLFKKYHIQRSQLIEIEKLLGSNVGAIFQNDDYVFLKNRNHIIIKKPTNKKIINELINSIPGQQRVGAKIFQFTEIKNLDIKFEPNTAYIDHSKIKEALTITNSFSGMRINPLGMNGTKLISDILTDIKLNRFEKDNQLILLHGNEVVWIAGKTISQKYAISNETKAVLKIEILE